MREANSNHGEKQSYARLLWFVIVPVAAILRFLELSRKSIYLDEALSVAYAHLPWREFTQVLMTRDANMAFYYLLLRGVVPFGDSEFRVRLLSVLAGVAAVPVMYWLGAKLYDRWTGIVAASVLALNACDVVYSQEARGYALALLMVTIASALFVKGIEAPSWRTWFCYALTSALAVHSHFYSALVLAAHWISLLALPRRAVPWKQLLLANVLAGTLISPAALFVVFHSPGHINWVPSISWLEVYHTLIFLTADGGKVAGNALLVLCALALAVAARGRWREDVATPVERWKHVFAWFWLLAPMLITAAGSVWTPMFFHRFLLICLPAYVLLVARGLCGLRPNAIWMTVFAAIALVTVFLSYARTREDWRSAAQQVLSQTQPGDGIWFYRGYADTPFLYYEERSKQSDKPVRVAGDEMPGVRAWKRLWVVFYPLSSADAEAKETMLTARYPVIKDDTFRGVRIVLFDSQFTEGNR